MTDKSLSKRVCVVHLTNDRWGEMWWALRAWHETPRHRRVPKYRTLEGWHTPLGVAQIYSLPHQWSWQLKDTISKQLCPGWWKVQRASETVMWRWQAALRMHLEWLICNFTTLRARNVMDLSMLGQDAHSFWVRKVMCSSNYWSNWSQLWTREILIPFYHGKPSAALPEMSCWGVVQVGGSKLGVPGTGRILMCR